VGEDIKKPLKVIVIDDEKTLSCLEYRADPLEVTYARTYEEGIALLEQSRWDELHLDWFLDESYVGQDVLDWLSEHVECIPASIIPCTDNFMRAKEIRLKAGALMSMRRKL